MTNPSWHEQALCAGHPDPDLWHYSNSEYKDEQQLEVLRSIEAIEICNQCPVKDLCLKQGMEDTNLDQSEGNGTIWGGKLQSERLMVTNRLGSSRRIRYEERHRRMVRAGRDSVKLAK
jgi:hypothetical protein